MAMGVAGKTFRISDIAKIFPQQGGWVYVPVPKTHTSTLNTFGTRGLVPIVATVGGATWDTSLLPMGDGTHFIALNAKVRKQEDIAVGKRVTVTYQLRDPDAQPVTAKLRKGFTLLEVLIVVAIIGVLGTIMVNSWRAAREKANVALAAKQMRGIAQSIQLYITDYGDYPPDVSRSVPPGLEAYLQGGAWPEAPWPNTVYDWDNWTVSGSGEKIYQISARFCPIGQPEECDFPPTEWAEDFDINSSVYYCLEGPCRAHIGQPISHPGYCINCDN